MLVELELNNKIRVEGKLMLPMLLPIDGSIDMLEALMCSFTLVGKKLVRESCCYL